MFDGSPYRDELRRRIDTVRRMLAAGDPAGNGSGVTDISREVRGLTIVLLFASYENLLRALCRGLLERAKMLRVGNRRLRPGFQQFAVQGLLDSIYDAKDKGVVWEKTGRELLKRAFHGTHCTVDTRRFPSDGSFIKSSQVRLIFDIFELGDPGPVLWEIWDRLDTVVRARNNIAHGTSTPEEVGREYTSAEIRNLVDRWERSWIAAIDHVETKASVRTFFRS